MQLTLLSILGDGLCHSGAVLAKQCKVSRTSVWKNITRLISLGLGIQIIPRRGYQLDKPLKILEAKIIKQYLLDKGFNKPLNYYIFASINSTNNFLKENTSTSLAKSKLKVEDKNPLAIQASTLRSICCAEGQINGRGRFQRSWVSPFFENIYCSLHFELAVCFERLASLSLVIGLALLNALNDFGIKDVIKIKWPNDLFWQNKKLGGILIETVAENNGYMKVIIGIGINVNTDTQSKSIAPLVSNKTLDLSQNTFLTTETTETTETAETSLNSWCSLYEITGKFFDRNMLIAAISYHVDLAFDKFLAKGLLAFIHDWQKYDYLYGQYVTVTQPFNNKILKGYAKGINEQGQLCLYDDLTDEFYYISSGDTSIRIV